MWIQESISSNKAKTIILLICFPILLYIITYLVMLLISKWDSAWESARNAIDVALTLSIIVTIIWTISLFAQKKNNFQLHMNKRTRKKGQP